MKSVGLAGGISPERDVSQMCIRDRVFITFCYFFYAFAFLYTLCKLSLIHIYFILAIGGGSVIDSAKDIGVGAAADGDVKDFYLRKRVPTRSLPVATILTFAAAGSEMSMSTVITDEHRKMPLDNDICLSLIHI